MGPSKRRANLEIMAMVKPLDISDLLVWGSDASQNDTCSFASITLRLQAMALLRSH